MKKSGIVTTVIAVAMVIPNMIWACSTCQGGFTQEQLDAYFAMTLGLTSIPLITAGLIAFFVLRLYRKKANLEKGEPLNK